ncbi:MAG: M48 family metallopeptidase [Bacteroidales bacterium]|nr:M48 family metallopeptidase [Bacteroidales bacterium]
MFKRKVIAAAAMLMCCAAVSSAQIKIGNRTINAGKALNAIGDVASAVTLSDADIARMCRESVEWMDAHNPIDEGEYDARLKRLTAGITDADGLPLNFKVYYVIDVNAFACGDGSIRVFSSLMDIMDDDELMAIIGHEIGHVVNHDVKDAMKSAYLASAARNAAGAVGGTIGQLSESQLGDVAAAFMGAQFSQKQEYAADDYGMLFAVKYGFSPYGMANSLNKLVELSKGEKASAVQKMFSSHPDSEKRAAKMKEKADKYVAENK